MKIIVKILFILVISFATKLQAQQHSDLYNYVDSLTKSTQFPRSNVFEIARPNGIVKYDNQPLLYINDSARVKDFDLFTKTEDLDNYSMSQVHSIQVWNRGSWLQRNGLGVKGLYGAIFVYTKSYVFPNPAKPTIPRFLMVDEDDQKRVIYLAPATVPVIIPPTNNKDKKK